MKIMKKIIIVKGSYAIIKPRFTKFYHFVYNFISLFIIMIILE